MPPEDLSADDAAILMLESAAITGHTLKLIELEPAPTRLDLEALRATVNARLPPGSRGRRRVDRSAPGGPRWIEDERFDVAAHVRRRDATAGIDRPGLWRVAGDIMSERLDHGRPLWAIDVVGPLTDGREALVVRIHHAMADGISCVRFLASSVWTSVADAAEHATGAPTPAPGASPREAELQHRRTALRWLPGAWWRELGGAVRRDLRGGAPASPLDRHVGPRRELAFSAAPLAGLKRIAGSRSGHPTVNDVLLAVVAGALREWLGPAGRLPVLRAQIPVSLHYREEGERDLGNRDSFLNVDLPLDEPDPLVRLDLIRDETEKRKRLGDAEVLYDFFHALSRFKHLGRRLERAAAGPHGFSVAISNVPGPREAIEVLGRRVERLASVAEPAERHALRISAISCAGTFVIGLCTDPDVLPGAGRLAVALDRSLAELTAAMA